MHTIFCSNIPIYSFVSHDIPEWSWAFAPRWCDLPWSQGEEQSACWGTTAPGQLCWPRRGGIAEHGADTLSVWCKGYQKRIRIDTLSLVHLVVWLLMLLFGHGHADCFPSGWLCLDDRQQRYLPTSWTIQCFPHMCDLDPRRLSTLTTRWIGGQTHRQRQRVWIDRLARPTGVHWPVISYAYGDAPVSCIAPKIWFFRIGCWTPMRPLPLQPLHQGFNLMVHQRKTLWSCTCSSIF